VLFPKINAIGLHTGGGVCRLLQSFTLPTGPTHHKKIDLEQNKMLYYYYWVRFRRCFFAACAPAPGPT